MVFMTDSVLGSALYPGVLLCSLNSSFFLCSVFMFIMLFPGQSSLGSMFPVFSVKSVPLSVSHVSVSSLASPGLVSFDCSPLCLTLSVSRRTLIPGCVLCYARL